MVEKKKRHGPAAGKSKGKDEKAKHKAQGAGKKEEARKAKAAEEKRVVKEERKEAGKEKMAEVKGREAEGKESMKKEKGKAAARKDEKGEKEKGRKEEKGKGKGKGKEEKGAKDGKAEARAAKRKRFRKPERPVIKKSKEVKRLSGLVRAKKRRMFRGRFGKRGSVRKISNKKWQKWRRPRGIDIYFRKEDGLVPGKGYGRPKEIRFVHPSGYRERLVRNMQELLTLEKERESVAARISGKVGLKKKIEILKKADELKIVVLNR